MNNNERIFNSRQKHYGDLDQTGNFRNATDRSREPDPSSDRRYRDYRYGDGGNTYGDASSYYHVNSKNENTRYSRQQARQRPNIKSGYGTRYGTSGDENDYSDFMNFNYGYGSGLDRGPSNTGYDRGFKSYKNTGYGATRYNNRDADREREAYGRDNRQTSGYSNRGVPDYSTRNIGDDYGAGSGDTYSSGAYGRTSGRYGEDMVRGRSNKDWQARDSDRGGYVNRDPNY
ncbi:hypothetical protein ACSX1A_10025 [Pontibacter sp. MBLB2868]|uniref:hypothetical protein n=1 Tax=Pontibacter sp. MBLB2868 TaxID=3451555 RepID=UPI003F74B4C3